LSDLTVIIQVHYNKYAGTKLKFNEADHLIFRNNALKLL
jgi:hypothetical protein